MLVLTRHAGESFVIGEDIEIYIIDIQGDKVKIGIRAPKDISVLRKELIIEVENSNTEAADADVSLDALRRVIKQNK